MRYTKTKKIISLLISLCTVFGLFGIGTAQADSNTETNSILAYGIDVSSWQGSIDWKKVKADGKDFAILRAGTTKGKDNYFERNYTEAKAAGVDLGCYMYTYATTVEEAEKDADMMLSWLAGKEFEYPIYYDMEDQVQLAEGMTTELRTEMILAFCKKLNDAGWYTGVYANPNWFNNYLNEDLLAQNHEIWLASWPVSGTPSKDYSYRCGLWQYSAQGKVNGIDSDVDLNVAYFDYPELIKKGEKPVRPEKPEAPTVTKVDEEWIVTSSDGVNVRSGPGTDFQKVSFFNPGTRIHVTGKISDDSYTWGRIELNGQECWCVLDFAKQTTSELLSNNEKITIDENNLILGLEPGEEVYDDLFKVSGLAEIKTEQTKSGFGTGTKIHLVLGETTVNTYYVVIDGDINGDCYIDSFDLVHSYAITNFELEYDVNSAQFRASDLNKDGVCDVFDSNLMAEIVNFEK